MAFVYISSYLSRLYMRHEGRGKATKVDDNVSEHGIRRVIREIEMKLFLNLVARIATRRKDMLFDSF